MKPATSFQPTRRSLRVIALVACILLLPERSRSDEPQTDNATTVLASSVPLFEVERFKVRYDENLALTHTDLPSEGELEALMIDLKEAEEIDVPAPKVRSSDSSETHAQGTSGTVRKYTPKAVMVGISKIVERLNHKGIYGVFVSVQSREIDALENKVVQSPTGARDLTFQIHLNKLGETHTARYAVPIAKGATPRVDAPRDLWIKTHSPIQPGGLLKKDALQEYLERLNRFPGRRVDTSLSAGKTDETLDITYIIREERNLFCNYQISNSGSHNTPVWRSQLGLEYRHLTRFDDYLRATYSSNDYKTSNSGQLSYDISCIAPDYLKARTYTSASQSTSEDLGQTALGFDSSQYSVGQQIVWTPKYIAGWPLDFTLGAYWMHVNVDNRSSEIRSATDFFLPYIGIGTERSRETHSLSANLQIETNIPQLAGTKTEDFAALGRFDADKHFSVARWNTHASFWLDPFFHGKDWEDSKIWWKACRAHELSGTFRGQTALNGGRLVPQMEAVIGGFDSARGYPESLTAGDTGLISSLEYRFHVVRQCIKPSSEMRDKEPTLTSNEANTYDQRNEINKPAGRFLFRPPAVASVADWDVICRTFIDCARTENNKALAGLEANTTLLSVGVGVELQTYKPAFCAIRADLGFALRGTPKDAGHTVEAGDARLHVSATFAW